MCPTERHSWILQANGVSQPTTQVTHPPFLAVPSFPPPLPPTSLIIRGRMLVDTSPPPSPTASRPWRERGGKKKTCQGAKCERGLVSMPTAGGQTRAASQPGSLQDTCFCPSCSLSLPALPTLPSMLSLSVGEIRLGPVPGIKPYLSSWS